MPGVIRPPWGAPTGPELSDFDLIGSFVDGARTGYSRAYHIEDRVLLAHRTSTVAIRCAGEAILLRTDIPTRPVRSRLKRMGLISLVTDPPLATVVGLQVAGLPAATWDLWGKEPSQAEEALMAASAGESP